MSVAAPRDVAVIVDLARLVAPCRQPEPGADRSGPAEVLRILNRGRKRGRSHGADARHRHQDLACLALAGAGDELPPKLGRAHAHGSPRVKERKQDRGKSLLISFDQEVLNQHLNLVTPEYPFFESPWGPGLMGLSNRGSLCKALLSGRTCAGFRVVFAVGTGPLHDGSSRGWDLPRWTTHSAGLSSAHHQAG